jgi:hypothetical protein
MFQIKYVGNRRLQKTNLNRNCKESSQTCKGIARWLVYHQDSLKNKQTKNNRTKLVSSEVCEIVI